MAAENVVTTTEGFETVEDQKKISEQISDLKASFDNYAGESKWTNRFELINSTTRKRGLQKIIVSAIVDHMYESLVAEQHEIGEANFIMHLKVLNKITDGKIFLEVIKAKILLNLSHWAEKTDVKEAKDYIKDLQIETFTNIAWVEKYRYILIQMRIVLMDLDFIRLQIMSKKINDVILRDPDFHFETSRYYNYLTYYFINEEQYLEAANCIKKFYDKNMLVLKKKSGNEIETEGNAASVNELDKMNMDLKKKR